jgi:hypothetical protein
MNADDTNTDTQVDWVQVSREGHELTRRHGQMAHIFAADLADRAESAGDIKAAQFWRAVARSLSLRV